MGLRLDGRGRCLSQMISSEANDLPNPHESDFWHRFRRDYTLTFVRMKSIGDHPESIGFHAAVLAALPVILERQLAPAEIGMQKFWALEGRHGLASSWALPF